MCMYRHVAQQSCAQRSWSLEKKCSMRHGLQNARSLSRAGSWGPGQHKPVTPRGLGRHKSETTSAQSRNSVSALVLQDTYYGKRSFLLDSPDICQEESTLDIQKASCESCLEGNGTQRGPNVASRYCWSQLLLSASKVSRFHTKKYYYIKGRSGGRGGHG